MDATVSDRVSAGMAWLDEYYPDHVVRVDLDLLDLGHSRRCALAQAGGNDFTSVAELWGLSTDREWELGFIHSRTPWRNPCNECGTLTEEWRRQYGERIDAIALAANEFEADLHVRD